MEADPRSRSARAPSAGGAEEWAVTSYADETMVRECMGCEVLGERSMGEHVRVVEAIGVVATHSAMKSC